jgi:hypothetical protein
MRIKPSQLNSSQVQGHAGPSGSLTLPNAGRVNGSDLANSLETTSEGSFMAVAKGYSRDDLQNPGKTDALVKSAAEHLAGQHLTGLPVEHQQAFSGWIQNDPLLRQQILSYFEAKL